MKILNQIRNKKGTTMVLHVITFTVIAACASIVVDIGVVAYKKADTVKATDAAALAGAQSILYEEDNPIMTAREYLQKNGVNPDDANIEILGDNAGIKVTTKTNVNYVFAQLLGFESTEVNASATAKIMAITSVYKGIRPFAIEEQDLEFGTLYTLKEGGGSGSNGNYGGLALGGTGANNYRFNILNGYDGELKVGDYVTTETGNMSNPTKSSVNELISRCNHHPRCTYDSFNPDCSRVVTVVIVDDLDVNGRSSVQILGFASFFLIAVEGQGNECVVKGYFVRNVTQGESNEVQKNYGLSGVKLTQ
ncbi:MAG: hypothetical protein GX270_12115 [Clostridiaceae bacterium]|jgi:Flp pilus assembly protein TadG|nr:hypothetical protein [Clostridiaceae bacterium]